MKPWGRNLSSIGIASYVSIIGGRSLRPFGTSCGLHDSKAPSAKHWTSNLQKNRQGLDPNAVAFRPQLF